MLSERQVVIVYADHDDGWQASKHHPWRAHQSVRTLIMATSWACGGGGRGGKKFVETLSLAFWFARYGNPNHLLKYIY
jgi:hypothetical protein